MICFGLSPYGPDPRMYQFASLAAVEVVGTEIGYQRIYLEVVPTPGKPVDENYLRRARLTVAGIRENGGLTEDKMMYDFSRWVARVFERNNGGFCGVDWPIDGAYLAEAENRTGRTIYLRSSTYLGILELCRQKKPGSQISGLEDVLRLLGMSSEQEPHDALDRAYLVAKAYLKLSAA